MKFINFGSCDAIIPESEVVMIKNKEKRTMEIFHARDLTCPLYSFSIIKLEGGHDLPNEIARILKRYVPDESKK